MHFTRHLLRSFHFPCIDEMEMLIAKHEPEVDGDSLFYDFWDVQHHWEICICLEHFIETGANQMTLSDVLFFEDEP